MSWTGKRVLVTGGWSAKNIESVSEDLQLDDSVTIQVTKNLNK